MNSLSALEYRNNCLWGFGNIAYTDQNIVVVVVVVSATANIVSLLMLLFRLLLYLFLGGC